MNLNNRDYAKSIRVIRVIRVIGGCISTNKQLKAFMQNLKILIVEDEFLISNDIQGLLTDWGYQVVGVVASGEEALPIFIKEQPDMALVDIQLSGQLDGIDTVRQFNNIQLPAIQEHSLVHQLDEPIVLHH